MLKNALKKYLSALTVFFVALLSSCMASAQPSAPTAITIITTSATSSFTSFFTGDTNDVRVGNVVRGTVLAGGGGDNDDAMKWFLERTRGGDVVILRASGGSGYNEYLFSKLGINVNSVETLLITSRDGANDEYVARRVREAEAVFIAGGDQHKYFTLWRGTKLFDALQYILSEKPAVVGGTSAGMMILGGAYYVPPGASAQSVDVLANPFHENMNILGANDFLRHPFLRSTLNDTHYDERNRSGRHVAFLARIENDFKISSLGIACNERTAVCIDEKGVASVFGSREECAAYFIQSDCTFPQSAPERVKAGEPLEWNKQGKALRVYVMKGMGKNMGSFDLKNWRTAEGGEWQNWFVQNGTLRKTPGNAPDCIR